MTRTFEELSGLCARMEEEMSADLSRLRKGEGNPRTMLAKYLAEISRIFLEAAVLPTYEKSWAIHKMVDMLLRGVPDIGNKVDTNTGKFLANAHGVTDTSLAFELANLLSSRKPLRMKFDHSDLSWLQIYNAIHWGAVAQYYGAEPIRELSLNCHGVEITFDKHGLIFLTPELALELVGSTPHLIDTGMKRAIMMEVIGSSILTQPELFSLLRNASNSLHSVQLKVLLSNINNTIIGGCFENYIYRIREAVGIYSRGLGDALQKNDPPVIQAALAAIFHVALDYPFSHFFGHTLAKRYGKHFPSTIGLLELAMKTHDSLGILIELDNKAVRIIDWGLCEDYAGISRHRHGCGTSSFLTEAMATERRFMPNKIWIEYGNRSSDLPFNVHWSMHERAFESPVWQAVFDLLLCAGEPKESTAARLHTVERYTTPRPMGGVVLASKLQEDRCETILKIKRPPLAEQEWQKQRRVATRMAGRCAFA